MIRMTGYISFFGAAVAAVIAMGGCSSSSDNESQQSSAIGALGESCGRTADCLSGLVCIAQTCAAKGTAVGADGGIVITPVGDGGGSVLPVADAGPVGVDAAPPRLSGRGESCRLTGDCGAGLSCIPVQPYGFGGICDVTSYGITPSGKSCSGECNAAADCCQLPVFNPAITLNSPASVPITIHNCADILNGVLSGTTTQCAASPAAGTPVNEGCFLYQTYCQCAANTWSCTNSACSYTAACSNATGYALGGCPSQARVHSGLPTTCTAAACAPAATVGTCATDTDCDGKVVADTGFVNATCRGGDCACVAKACYVKCNSELDCGQGYSCNKTSKVCTQNGACTTDTDCQSSLSTITGKCSAGQCTTTCKTDNECSESGLKMVGYSSPYNRFTGLVCGQDGLCHDSGCSSDADCADTTGGNAALPHLLCVTPATTPTQAIVHSAITN